jgi:hypothetical protein
MHAARQAIVGRFVLYLKDKKRDTAGQSYGLAIASMQTLLPTGVFWIF